LPDRAALNTGDAAWSPSYRLVHSCFPTAGLFDACESEDELAIVAAIQGLTKDRIRQGLGRIHLVPEVDRLFGHGTTPVMAAFCYVSPVPTRFTDGSFGVYYAASLLEGAVAEVSHHLVRLMAATQEPQSLLTLRCYTAAIARPVVDLCAQAWVHTPNAYGDTQALAARLRQEGAWGLLHQSVRHAGSQCVVVLRPRAVQTPLVQHTHVLRAWDGARIASWYRLGALKRL
jgi:RES domain